MKNYRLTGGSLVRWENGEKVRYPSGSVVALSDESAERMLARGAIEPGFVDAPASDPIESTAPEKKKPGPKPKAKK